MSLAEKFGLPNGVVMRSPPMNLNMIRNSTRERFVLNIPETTTFTKTGYNSEGYTVVFFTINPPLEGYTQLAVVIVKRNAAFPAFGRIGGDFREFDAADDRAMEFVKGLHE